MSIPQGRGYLLGEGLFETIHVVSGTPVCLAEHLARMERSADALGLPVPDDLGESVWHYLEVQLEAFDEPARAALRVTLSAGTGRGLVPRAPAAPWLGVFLTPLPDAADTTPWRAVTVGAHRVDPGAAISGHKALSWMPWILARREALARGADVALVTTVDGDVCEADHANVFAVIDGVVVTPGLDRGVLPGVTRGRALAALRADGRDVFERALALDELRRASEVWLTSSLDGVRAVATIDDVDLASPGPVTTWLADCVKDA